MPFLYGIRREGNFRADLSLVSPRDCIARISDGSADVALIPADAVPSLGEAHPVTGYCIGAAGRSPLALLAGAGTTSEVRRVLFDPDRTAAMRLAAHVLYRRWNLAPEFAACPPGEFPDAPDPGDLLLLTGDRAAFRAPQLPLFCDLTAEWRRLARLPFVFWVWIARVGVDPEWIEGLHNALTFGIEHTYEALAESEYAPRLGEAYAYSAAFDYIFDNQKEKALRKFWDAGLKIAPRVNPG